MLQKTLLVVGSVLLLCGGALFVAMAGGDAAPPALAAGNDADRRAAAIAGADATTTPAPPDARANEPTQRSCAGGQPASPRPFPDEAEWITVTVVDRQMQAPVARARRAADGDARGGEHPR